MMTNKKEHDASVPEEFILFIIILDIFIANSKKLPPLYSWSSCHNFILTHLSYLIFLQSLQQYKVN